MGDLILQGLNFAQLLPKQLEWDGRTRACRPKLCSALLGTSQSNWPLAFALSGIFYFFLNWSKGWMAWNKHGISLWKLASEMDFIFPEALHSCRFFLVLWMSWRSLHRMLGIWRQIPDSIFWVILGGGLWGEYLFLCSYVGLSCIGIQYNICYTHGGEGKWDNIKKLGYKN